MLILQLRLQRTRLELGDPQLSAEQSYQADASIGWTGARWSALISPFYNYFPNYIYLNPTSRHVKPFLLIRSSDIPENSKTFNVQEEISVPMDIDPGDYHFMIRLTDEEGWQTIKGLSIKIE